MSLTDTETLKWLRTSDTWSRTLCSTTL